MSPRKTGTEFTPSTHVSIHTGNPDLLRYDEAKELLAQQELKSTHEVAPPTPQAYLRHVGVVLSAARTYELDSAFGPDEPETITARNLDVVTRSDFDLAA